MTLALSSARSAATLLSAVAVRPRLWLTALRSARRFAPDGWWRSPPWLPLPDASLIGWRTQTQYGDPGHAVRADHLVAWLEWCRAEHRRIG